MYYYTLVHSHKHGVDNHIFKSEKNFNNLPDDENVAKILNIDFEPDNWNENIEVFTIDLNNIKEI